MKRCAAQAGCVQNQWFSGAQVHRTSENVARRKLNVSQTNGKVGNVLATVVEPMVFLETVLETVAKPMGKLETVSS
jgi:hypothetical protein